MIKAHLISIGDELLIGQTINTNVAWLGQELAKIGIKVNFTATISDDKKEIENALDVSLKKAKIILITGGLGPTKDDITKHVLNEYFGGELKINEEVLHHITSYFEARNRPMLEVNRMQALLPSTCKMLFNKVGTAAGMLFEKNGSIVVSMPGVPYEMKQIMTDHVFEEIMQRFETAKLVQKTILVQGLGESFLAEEIKDWENEVREKGFSLAYLPSPGIVKLRLSSERGEKDEKEIDTYFEQIKQRLPKYVFGEEKDTLPEVIQQILSKRNETLTTIESCTGGKIAENITEVAGASAVFIGGMIPYSVEMKQNILTVPEAIIQQCGVVSEEVAIALAENGRKKMGSDYAISTTGFAGPTGGDEKNPIGTVWIGISGKKRSFAKKFNFGDNRQRNIQMTMLTALNLLRCELLGLNS